MAEMVLRATGSKLKIISEIHVTSTQAQYDTCLFEFDEAWDGYGMRTAVFYSNPNSIKPVLLDSSNRCFIPWDAFSASRYLYIGLYGNDGSSYLPTQFVEVMYQPGANLDDHLYPPTPGIYEQIAAGVSGIMTQVSSKAAQADVDGLVQALAGKASNASLSAVESEMQLKASSEDLLDIQAQVDGLVSGSPKGTYATLADLQTAKPSGDTGIYIVLADGNWYYWDGSAWASGGVYQSAGLDEGVWARYEQSNYYGKVTRDYGGLTLMEGYNAGTTAIFEYAGYNTWTFVAERPFSIYVDGIPTGYFCIALFANGVASPENAKGRYRTTNNNLPTAGNKLSVASGDLVAVSTPTAFVTWSFYANYPPAVGRNLNDSVKLGGAQFAQIEETYRLQNLVSYYGTTSTDNGLMIYIPTTLGMVRYDFKHAYDLGLNADNWRINSIYSVDDKQRTKFRITVAGEMECAVHLEGRPDFSGGIGHGNEVQKSLQFFVDGRLMEASAIGVNAPFRELKIVQVSDLYDPLDNVTVIAEHGKEYTFTRENLVLNQYVDWKVDEDLGPNYLAMLPIAKADGALTVSEHFYHNRSFTPLLCADHVGGTLFPNAKKVTVYSDKSGVLATMAIPVYPTGRPQGDALMLNDNNGNPYNKMYFNVGRGSIAPGDYWQSTTIYTFQVGKGANVQW